MKDCSLFLLKRCVCDVSKPLTQLLRLIVVCSFFSINTLKANTPSVFDLKNVISLDSTKPKVKKAVTVETKSVTKSAYFDFTRLLEDDKLKITIATGYTEEVTDAFGVSFHFDLAEKINHWLLSRGFYPTQTEGNIREYETTEIITDPNTQAAHRARVYVTLIMPGKGSAKAFMEAMNKSEIIYYAGHARGGLGPDFDSRNSSDEQLVWGLHEKTNKYDNPSGSYYKKISHKDGNDLEKAYNNKNPSAKESPYRIWMLNACKTQNLMDEFQNGLTPGKDQLDVVLSNSLVYMGSYFESMHIFMDTILQATPIDKMIYDMNTLHDYISEEADWEPKKPYFYKRIK
jgi:hypothetical protein